MSRETLSRNLERIARHLERAGGAKQVRLVAVTKGLAPEQISWAQEIGLQHFAESRAQEAELHFPNRPPMVRLDFIGNLQRNKVTRVLRFCDVIQSVADLACWDKILAVGTEGQRCRGVFFEVNPLQQPSKHGFSSYEALQQAAARFRPESGLQVLGLMTMAPLAAEPQVRLAFSRCREWQQQLCRDFELPDCVELSMGMSNDYLWAIAEGSTMVRLGRALFGDR